MNTRLRILAHDSGDGAVIRHCPFCGGGQVIGRSDGTVECEYCPQAFTIQVQPMFAGFPQSVNGQPFPIPGMPGQIGGPPAAPGPDGLDDPGGNPFADDEEDTQDPGTADDNAPPWADDSTDDNPGGDAPPPPPAKKKSSARAGLYRTASGASLSGRAYAEYLAVRHARDGAEREELLERLRTSRN